MPFPALRQLGQLLVLVAMTAGLHADEPQLPLIERARVTVPTVVTFQVPNVSATTEAISGSTVISFDQAILTPGRGLRLSVKADSDLTRADGGPVPSATIAWRTSGASNGVGINGVLNKSSFTPVYQSNALVDSGRVTLTWSITLGGTSYRAGTHQVLVRWRVDSAIP